MPGFFLEEGLGMTWWTHLLFFGRYPEVEPHTSEKEEHTFVAFRRALKQYLYENFIDLLYVFLSIFTYFYLGISIVAFFFPAGLPPSIPYIIDILSEPYLGALGVYVVVKEIERRRGHIKKRRGELFATLWFVFLMVATFLTYFSEQYQLSQVYKNIATNALAALIIRIGTLLR